MNAHMNTARRAASATRAAVRPLRRPALGSALVTGALLALTACGGQTAAHDGAGTDRSTSRHGGGKKVLWLGDSIAGGEAPALAAAAKAAGLRFKDASSTGGGTVVAEQGPTKQIAAHTWKRLPKDIAAFHPDVIAYQITTYDWDTEAGQRHAYEKLGRTARNAGAELVIVSAPPFTVDDFYKPHEKAIRSAPRAARQAAARSGGKIHYFDSAELWGTDSRARRAQRSSDGIHACQQGAAAFAKWFGEKLGKQYGFAPAPPRKWAQGAWTGSGHYADLGCR
ncbi:SGNH/GDSL hydrolase family protein [Streptomyces albus]|uniref:SGNH/GDSL hydrolase family protein n=1 Tax=Streptomyces albus TaxID=1888 RepID=UPI003F1C301F